MQVGNPVILMVEPEKNSVQEIKVGTKAKIMDMVAIRHVAAGSQEEKTTLILLCEDGSLKIYMAGAEATGYWLQPGLQPAGQQQQRALVIICNVLSVSAMCSCQYQQRVVSICNVL